MHLFVFVSFLRLRHQFTIRLRQTLVLRVLSVDRFVQIRRLVNDPWSCGHELFLRVRVKEQVCDLLLAAVNCLQVGLEWSRETRPLAYYLIM